MKNGRFVLNWDYIANWSEWVAPVATIIAALMTAANLGSRVTGWGFVVFLVGSVHWTLLGFATGQSSLLAANSFLCLINALGVWRWLGVKAKLDDGAHSAERKSEKLPTPALISLANVEGQTVTTVDDIPIGQIRGGMMERDSGRVSYVVVASDGMVGAGETLHSVPWCELTPTAQGFSVSRQCGDITQQQPLDPAEWPARVRPIQN